MMLSIIKKKKNDNQYCDRLLLLTSNFQEVSVLQDLALRMELSVVHLWLQKHSKTFQNKYLSLTFGYSTSYCDSIS